MKNLLNIFKEIQDPKVLRYLTIGFAALVVTVFLAFFVTSSSFRHKVLHPNFGIGQNDPVTKEHRSYPKPPSRSGDAQNGGGFDRDHSSHSSPGPKGNGANPPSSSGGGGNPSHPHPKIPKTPGIPNPIPSTSSSPGNSSDNGNSENSKAGGVKAIVEGGGAKVEAEVNIPPIVEEVIPDLPEPQGQAWPLVP